MGAAGASAPQRHRSHGRGGQWWAAVVPCVAERCQRARRRCLAQLPWNPCFRFCHSGGYSGQREREDPGLVQTKLPTQIGFDLLGSMSLLKFSVGGSSQVQLPESDSQLSTAGICGLFTRKGVLSRVRS